MNGSNAFNTDPGAAAERASDSAFTESLCGAAAPANTFNRDIWYFYNATGTGNTRFSLCGSSFDTKLAIYAGCPTANNQALACNEDSDACGVGSTRSDIVLGTVQGTVYVIRVGGHNNGSGTGTLTITPPIPNDTCNSNFTFIQPGVTLFNNTNADTSGPAIAEANLSPSGGDWRMASRAAQALGHSASLAARYFARSNPPRCLFDRVAYRARESTE